MIPATISRGDVVLCDLNPVIGMEQAGIRLEEGYMKEIEKALSVILGL